MIFSTKQFLIITNFERRGNQFMALLGKLYRCMTRLRLQPIRIFCFHQVSETFDTTSMWKCDWLSKEEFKNKIVQLQEEYTFISLEDAHMKLKNDIFRIRKYAVLTADDGSKTIECILPWLKARNIPVTLFLNGSYLNGKTYRETPAERYYTKDEILSLAQDNITIGHHGWDHVDVKKQTVESFMESIQKNIKALEKFPNNVPYWAYPYGGYTSYSDRILQKYDLCPVYTDGQKNYNDPNRIHREIL